MSTASTQQENLPNTDTTAPAAEAPVDWQAKAQKLEADLAKAASEGSKTAKQMAEMAKKLDATKAQIDDPKFQRSIAAKLLGTPDNEDPAATARAHQAAAEKATADAASWRNRHVGSVKRQEVMAALLKVPDFNAELVEDAVRLFDMGVVDVDEDGSGVTNRDAVKAAAVEFINSKSYFKRVVANAAAAPAPGAPTPTARPPMPPHQPPAPVTQKPALSAKQLWDAPMKDARAARDAVFTQHGFKN